MFERITFQKKKIEGMKSASNAMMLQSFFIIFLFAFVITSHPLIRKGKETISVQEERDGKGGGGRKEK